MKVFEELRRRTNLIPRALGEAVYGLDLHGSMTSADPAAAEMTAWEVEELIGKPQHARESPVAYAGATEGITERKRS